jgi:hypothetical protein
MNVEDIEKQVQELKQFLDNLIVNTVTRAHKQVNNLKKRNTQLEQYQDEVCKLLNVDNIGNAIKRLKSLTNATILPPEFQQEPAIWLTGSEDFPRLDYHKAKLYYNKVLPLIKSVYNKIIDTESDSIAREETLTAFRECYERSAPDTFQVSCINYLFDTDIVVESKRHIVNNRNNDPLSSELMTCLDELNNIDYGTKKHF